MPSQAYACFDPKKHHNWVAETLEDFGVFAVFLICCVGLTYYAFLAYKKLWKIYFIAHAPTVKRNRKCILHKNKRMKLVSSSAVVARKGYSLEI
jgi:hypothetical protein